VDVWFDRGWGRVLQCWGWVNYAAVLAKVVGKRGGGSSLLNLEEGWANCSWLDRGREGIL